LRDARPEHFLFDKDELSGMVDFGAMAVDTVAGDIARLIGEWFNDDRSAHAIAIESYERVRPLDSVETSLIGLFQAATTLLIGERWIRWHFLESRHFDDAQAVTWGLERSIKPLERLVLQTPQFLLRN
jgi:homoserine kinase type II